MKWVHLDETYDWLLHDFEEPNVELREKFNTQYAEVPDELAEALKAALVQVRTASDTIDEWLKANNPNFKSLTP